MIMRSFESLDVFEEVVEGECVFLKAFSDDSFSSIAKVTLISSTNSLTHQEWSEDPV